jgi:hypothetical protein
MGLATAGFVLGIVFTAISVLWIVAVVLIFASAVHQIHDQNTSGALVLSAARAYFGL